MMEAHLDVQIKVKILNVSHSEGTEWNLRLIRYDSGEFFQAAGVFFWCYI